MSAPNWLGLLKWSLAHSDGTSDSSTVTAMSEEDRKWLEKVLKESVRDDPKRMNDILMELNNLLSQTEGSLVVDEDKLDRDLQELRDIIEQIDMAQIWSKCGGIEILFQLMNKEEINISIRTYAVAIISTCCQNNLIVQNEMFQSGYVDKLSQSFFNHTTPTLLTKLLQSLSCLIRNHAAAEEYFTIHYLEPILQKCITLQQFTPLFHKSIFLCNALITSEHYTDPQRIFKIVNTLIPSVLHLPIEENALHLLMTLLQTEKGWQSLHEISKNELQEYLNQFYPELDSSEHEWIEGIKKLLENDQKMIEFPRNMNHSNNIHGTTQQTNSPMLLLANAASSTVDASVQDRL